MTEIESLKNSAEKSYKLISECLKSKNSELSSEIKTLNRRLAKAELVCEALASLLSEDPVRKCVLCYNMGIILIDAIENWRRGNLS